MNPSVQQLLALHGAAILTSLLDSFHSYLTEMSYTSSPQLFYLFVLRFTRLRLPVNF